MSKAKFDALDTVIKDARLEQKGLVQAEFYRITGAQVGDHVVEVCDRFSDHRVPRRGVIARWHSDGYWPMGDNHRPWVMVQLLKKDGTPREGLVRFYDWKKEDPT